MQSILSERSKSNPVLSLISHNTTQTPIKPIKSDGAREKGKETTERTKNKKQKQKQNQKSKQKQKRNQNQKIIQTLVLELISIPFMSSNSLTHSTCPL